MTHENQAPVSLPTKIAAWALAATLLGVTAWIFAERVWFVVSWFCS
jgi:hypothetical protein